ncbi:uncharacterized protein [Panulirus ornatus]|uniref:uncharacterized protein n=1 Tax=Panulirus ornatus TaxID=150431 RepID=UPI003A88464B
MSDQDTTTRGYIFKNKKDNGERFGLVAVNPGGEGPVCVLVVTSRPGPCHDLLLLRPHQVGIMQPHLVATSHLPLTSLTWDLVPWVSEERRIQIQELVVTSTVREITISKFRDQGTYKSLVPLRVVLCDSPVSACVLQTWVPRIIYTGGSGAGKIDLTFHQEKLQVKNTLQFPPWLTEEEDTLSFVSIGCVENKWEVFLGDSRGRIYTYGTQHTTVDTAADKFALRRDMTVPFPIHSLITCPPSKTSSVVSILALDGNKRAAVLTVDPTRGTPCTLCPLDQEVCVAAWCKADNFALITTIDNKRQMHHWRKDRPTEPDGEWRLLAVSFLEEDGVGVAWSSVHPTWLAYITPSQVVLRDMSELIHH